MTIDLYQLVALESSLRVPRRIGSGALGSTLSASEGPILTTSFQ
jgi:hypothetical protein